MERSSLNLVWCDLEFTSTNLEHAQLMQAAMVITTPDLRPIRPPDAQVFPQFDVALSEEQAQSASTWVKDEQSELLKRCQEKGAVDKGKVDASLRGYVLECCKVPTLEANSNEEKDKLKKNNPILSGNSTHNDYRMIQRHLPGLADVISYRLVDVTTLKELVRRWKPDLKFDKGSMAEAYLREAGQVLSGKKHDALYDVWCSIAELNYYRTEVFNIGV